jgi:hypothetical protein
MLFKIDILLILMLIPMALLINNYFIKFAVSWLTNNKSIKVRAE